VHFPSPVCTLSSKHDVGFKSLHHCSWQRCLSRCLRIPAANISNACLPCCSSPLSTSIPHAYGTSRKRTRLTNTVSIECTKEGVKFACQGDIGSGSVQLRQHSSVEKPSENVEIDLTEPVSLTFSLKYLTNFCKASGLSDSVKLCLSSEVPLLVEYGMQNNSYLRFYLAPKVSHMYNFKLGIISNEPRSVTRSDCVMTSFGMSDMFSRTMWGIIGAESLICIGSVCGSLVWRVGLAKDAHSEVLRALVAKERVHQPHPPFSRHRARKQIRKSTKYNTALCAPILNHPYAVQTKVPVLRIWPLTNSSQTRACSQSPAM